MKQVRLLRVALRANAVFSSVCGLALLVAGGELAPRLGIPALALRLTGGVLLPFAVSLWTNARRTEVDLREVRLAVILDLAWVVGSAVLLVGGFLPLTTAGFGAVLGVAEVVLVLALMQGIGLHLVAKQPSPSGS